MNEGQNTLTLSIDGDPCRVPVGISVAAALSLCGDDRCRLSISHQPRPLLRHGRLPGVPGDH